MLSNLYYMVQFKRSGEVIRGPYNANAQSRYVELVMVLDNKEYSALGENMQRVNNHCKDIANIINAVSLIASLLPLYALLTLIMLFTA